MHNKDIKRYNSYKSIASWTNDSVNQSYTAFLNASFMKERNIKKLRDLKAKRKLSILSQSTKLPNKKKLPLPVISPLPQFRTLSPKIHPISSALINPSVSKLREYSNPSNCCSQLLPRFTFKCIKNQMASSTKFSQPH